MCEARDLGKNGRTATTLVFSDEIKIDMRCVPNERSTDAGT